MSDRIRDIKQCAAVGYYVPSGEHDPDPTEDIEFLLGQIARLRETAIECVNNAPRPFCNCGAIGPKTKHFDNCPAFMLNEWRRETIELLGEQK